MCASAGEQPCHIAVGTLGKLSWNSTNVIADFPASGGVLLRLNDAKKTGGLNAKRLALALGKYHQVAVTLSVNEPTTLILSLMQKDKNGEKVHFRETFSLAPGRHIVKSTVLAIAPYAEGSVDFSKDCTLHHFEITQIAAPAEPVKTVGNKTFLLQERAQEKPSDDPPEKPVFFRRPPRMVYEKSVPNRFERIDSLNTLAPTGEYAVFFFMLHNPSGTRSLQLLELDGFRQGKEYIPGNIFTVSQVRFWDFPRGQSTYFRIPEIIERQEPLTLAASSNCFYWIQGKIPKNAVPGTYTGSVSVRCGDELLQLPLTLEVPDLRLLDPENMVWSMYCNYRRLREYSATPAFQLRYLRDLTDYGISSVHFHISGASVSCVESIQKLRMASGLKGPVIIYGMFAEQILSKRHKPDPGPEWYKNPDIRKEFVEYLRNFDREFKKYGEYGNWLYMGHDEPHLSPQLMESARWQIRLAREANVKTVSNIYAPVHVKKVVPELDIDSNMFIGNNSGVYEQLMALKKEKAPAMEYWYLGGGCYNGQEGGLMPNRLLAGMLAFKMGVSGHLSYAYQSAQLKPGGPRENFPNKYYSMSYPAKKLIPEHVTDMTLEMEGVREGITDYKYLYTLKILAREAREKGHVRAAEEAEKALAEILYFVPFQDDNPAGNGITDPQLFNNDTADRLRCRAAYEIMQLKKVL